MSGHPFLLAVISVVVGVAHKAAGKLKLQPYQTQVAAQGKAPSRAAGRPQSWHRQGALRGTSKECKLDGEWSKSVAFEETPLAGIAGRESKVQSLGASASCLRRFLLE